MSHFQEIADGSVEIRGPAFIYCHDSLTERHPFFQLLCLLLWLKEKSQRGCLPSSLEYTSLDVTVILISFAAAYIPFDGTMLLFPILGKLSQLAVKEDQGPF